MNTNFKIYAFMTLALTVFAITGSTYATAQKPRELRTANVETSRRGMMPGVSSADQLTYQVGKDLTCLINDAKTMKDDNESFNYAVVDLVYLIDELEGQAEAAQLQAILKAIVRGKTDLATVSAQISSISNTYFTRQAAEQKWYFNVGKSQMNLMIAGWNKDAEAINKNAKELQNLSKTAPVGTSQLVLESIKGVSKYATMAQFTNFDFEDLVDDAKMITKLVYA